MLNATHCIVLAAEGRRGEEGGVFPVGVILVNNSSNIPLETLWYYGCALLWWRGDPPGKQRDYLPRYSGNFFIKTLKPLSRNVLG